MITVKAFRGLRPKEEEASKIASPPYDVLSSQEAREMARENPISFLHINKPEIDLPEDTDAYSDSVYQKGRENLKRLMAEGHLIQDDKESIYIYRQTWRDHVQTGYFVISAVKDYDEGRIKKHEFTRPQKEADRTRLIDVMNAQVGPVFLLYKDDPTLNDLLDEGARSVPSVDFTSPDEVRHQLWVIDDPNMINRITAAFENLEATYIADGHHRSASASNVCRMRKEKNPDHTGNEPYNYFLSVIFPKSHLKILPYNRVVTDLNDLTKEQLLEKVSENFDIQKAEGEFEVADEHEFGMYLDGDWYMLTPRTGSYNAGDLLEGLDVNILMKNLLEPVLGIGNPRTDPRIDFVGGIRGNKELQRLVDSGKFAVAFALYPTSVENLIRVADTGQVMPPKSTWFEPKLRSGMVSHLL
ncbi:MAG TPA: DUF1015 domain-containing protein [candidate division Zixibacteria bacterium]|nr:DUF1015 domain-containing protein [candidate division Zixibacteria bacterium]